MDYRDWKKLNKETNEHFWYQARRILISDLLQQALPGRDQKYQIIEIGCGTGIQLPLLAQFGPVEGLDIIPESIKIVKQAGFSARVFDIENDPLENNSADVIACFDVLEHLQNDGKALIKITTTLRKNGIFLFSVPAIPALFGPHDKAMGHYRRYQKKEIIKKFDAAGLEIKTIGYWNSWFLPAIIILRVIKKIITPKNTANSDTKALPKFLNYCLYQILAAETRLIKKGLKLPWGLSLYGYATKK